MYYNLYTDYIILYATHKQTAKLITNLLNKHSI